MRILKTIPIFLALVTCVEAATITLVSSSAIPNDSGNPTMQISPYAAWAGPMAGSSWISTAITGDSTDPTFTIFPNGTTIKFWQNFQLDGNVTAASLTVMADDTSDVVVNGFRVFASSTNDGQLCSAIPIGCLASTRMDFTMADLASHLNVGANTISFTVTQRRLVAFGLDFEGSIQTAPLAGTIPEPASMGLIGAGLLALMAGARFRGRRR